VPPGNPKALAEAIAELLSLPREERQRMGAAGREFAVRELNAAHETERLAGWIDATLDGRRA
jgi:glycosyltransferase involved in cell wall biosynthesis